MYNYLHCKHIIASGYSYTTLDDWIIILYNQIFIT